MTLACHVYNLFYCKVMTIVTCDLQFKNTNVQCAMWQKLNKVMVKSFVPNSNFKGFMVDNVQVNWNTIQIVYDNGDPSELKIDKEQTCFFH